MLIKSLKGIIGKTTRVLRKYEVFSATVVAVLSWLFMILTGVGIIFFDLIKGTSVLTYLIAGGCTILLILYIFLNYKIER